MDKVASFLEAEDANEPDYVGSVLSASQIADGKHRKWVGGHWDDQGVRQLEFMKQQGLLPHHKLLDVGCGSLRAGRHFAEYLEPGNYYGIDANRSVIQAGYDNEIGNDIRKRLPVSNLRATDRFGVDFGVQFDFALAQSVFTHINLNLIRLCLYRVGKVVKPGGAFYVTIFERSKETPLDEIWRTARGQPKFQERNCYWYYRSDMKWAAKAGPWEYEYIGKWGHPAGQRMIKLKRKPDEA